MPLPARRQILIEDRGDVDRLFVSVLEGNVLDASYAPMSREDMLGRLPGFLDPTNPRP